MIEELERNNLKLRKALKLIAKGGETYGLFYGLAQQQSIHVEFTAKRMQEIAEEALQNETLDTMGTHST